MKKMIISLIILAIAAFAWTFMRNRNAGFRTVTPAEFAEITKDSAVQLVDVRTPMEYAEGHLPGSMLIDVGDSAFLTKAQAQLSQERPVAVYCRSGRRSAKSANKLVKAGYEVINLRGGIQAWQRDGREVTK